MQNLMENQKRKDALREITRIGEEIDKQLGLNQNNK